MQTNGRLEADDEKSILTDQPDKMSSNVYIENKM